MGVSYQAVARDNYGKELANREIDVRFSVISGNPQGALGLPGTTFRNNYLQIWGLFTCNRKRSPDWRYSR